MLYENVKRIAKEKKIPISKIETAADMSSNSLHKWKTSTPSVDKVAAVASLLGTTIDELMKDDGD